MTIEPYAFKNCISLKEIDVSSIDNDVFMFGLMPDDNTPNSLSIIVQDKLYNEFVNNEIFSNKKKFVKYSDKIQQKIDLLKNTKILQIIYHLTCVNNILSYNNQFNLFIDNIIKTFLVQYNINKEEYSYFEYLQEKKEKIKNGKEI